MPAPTAPHTRSEIPGPSAADGPDDDASAQPAAVGTALSRGATTTTTAERAAPAGNRAGGQAPGSRRRPRQGQVVPLRPRITIRLKATVELLVLVSFLGLVASGIVVALVVGINQVLSGL